MKLLAVLVAALVFAGVAAADIYTDSTGEDPASADISTVTVTNDPVAKTISFQVAIANMPTIEDGAEIDIYLDTDLNQATGLNGNEYEYAYDDTDSVLAAVGDGNFTDTGATDLTSSYANGVLSVQFGLADIGNPTGFNFEVGTVRGPDPNNPAIDQAPDTGYWTYMLHTKATPPPTTTTTTTTTTATTPTTTPTKPGKKVTVTSTHAVYSGKPKAGKPFVVRSLRVKLSTGAAAGATGLKCTATLAGKTLKGTGKAGCDFHLTAHAKGKRLIIHARGKYGSTAVHTTVSWKVS